MADTKISALTEDTNPAKTDATVTVDDRTGTPVTKFVQWANVLARHVVTTAGDILYASAADTLARLAIGTANQVLRTNSGATAPEWVSIIGAQTVFLPASALRPTVSNGCAALTDVETTAGRPDMTVLDFDASADEHAQFQLAMPKRWNLGTVTYRVFWTVSAAVTTGVTWALQGVAVSDNDTIDVAYGTAVTVDDTALNAAEDMHVTATSGAVTIGGTPAAADMCYFRLFRDVSDANDTMTQDARLLGLQLFWTENAYNDD